MKQTITIRIPSFRDTVKNLWDHIILNFPEGCSFAAMHKYAIGEEWTISYHKTQKAAIKNTVKHPTLIRFIFDIEGYHIIKNNSVWDRDSCYISLDAINKS